MGDNGWAARAPCASDARFRDEEAASDPGGPLTRQLLAVCEDCPFRSPCVDLVLPARSLFDGVCGGRVWRDGQVLATCGGATASELREQGPRPITHGTEAGARAHNRRGERACSLCREAGRLAQQARRAKKHTTTP